MRTSQGDYVMPNYTITESVGGDVQRVNSYRDLEKHHPSSGREDGRDYQTIDGELEEVRLNRAVPHVKKDFIIDPPTIPAPVSGTIRHLNDDWNTVQIVDDNGKVLAQALHMARGSQPPDGSRIEYGQTMGRMGDVGSPGSIHAHVEAPAPVFERYINDITSGRIQSNGQAVPGGAANIDPMADGILRRGEEGAAVKQLQEALNKAGIRDAQGQPLPTTGYYGDMTEAAVRKYQEQKSLEVDGKAGNDTLTALGLKQGQQPAQQAPTQQAPTQQAPTPQTPAQQPTGGTISGGPNDFGPSNPLGALISSGEGGYGSYNRGRAGDANGAQIDFSQMTVGEVMRRQDLPRNDPDRLFAVGKYQMIPDTLAEGVQTLGIDRNAKFTPQLQERMFADFLIDEKRPQVKDYITGQTGGQQGLQSAQLALAREFASIADPRTGRSVYDGDSAGNSASITAGEVGTVLTQMRGQYQQNISSGMSPAEAYRALSGDPNAQGQTQGQTQGGQTQGQGGGTSDTLLIKEERGDGVKRLQEALNSAGIRDAEGKPLPTTGYYGDMTEAAVRKYQEQKGLEVDGKAGKDTLTALGIYPGQQQTPAGNPRATPTTADAHGHSHEPTPPTASDKPPVSTGNTPNSPQTVPAAPNAHGHSHEPTPATATDKPQTPAPAGSGLISSPDYPDKKLHGLYQQAVSNLEQLGASGGFKSREELEKAAAAVAVDAKATGLKEIDHISRTTGPSGQNFLVAVQGDPTNPTSKSSYIDYGQAVNQTVEQSTRMGEKIATAVQPAQPAQPADPVQEPNKIAINAR
jgi:peptidoglycan hydrolase-like protein with peptidoglycan-binding domain